MNYELKSRFTAKGQTSSGTVCFLRCKPDMLCLCGAVLIFVVPQPWVISITCLFFCLWFVSFHFILCYTSLMVNYADIRDKINRLTIRDNVIFGAVMLEENICRELLETILNIKIDRVEYFEREKVIENSILGKGVRLDVYVADGKGTVYDIEMQVSPLKNDNLLKRARYYSANIDIDNLKKGNAYVKLPKTFVIFICLFDPFNKGCHVYTFKRSCLQDPDINDGTTLIFLNAKGIENDVSPKLKAFLNYVIGIKSDDSFVRTLEKAVEDTKMDSVRMERYVSTQEYIDVVFNEGHSKGIAEGHAQGIAEIIKRLIDSGISVEKASDLLGYTSDEIRGML